MRFRIAVMWLAVLSVSVTTLLASATLARADEEGRPVDASLCAGNFTVAQSYSVAAGNNTWHSFVPGTVSFSHFKDGTTWQGYYAAQGEPAVIETYVSTPHNIREEWHWTQAYIVGNCAQSLWDPAVFTMIPNGEKSGWAYLYSTTENQDKTSDPPPDAPARPGGDTEKKLYCDVLITYHASTGEIVRTEIIESSCQWRL